MNEYRNTADRTALSEQTRRAVLDYAGGDKMQQGTAMKPAVLKIDSWSVLLPTHFSNSGVHLWGIYTLGRIFAGAGLLRRCSLCEKVFCVKEKSSRVSMSKSVI